MRRALAVVLAAAVLAACWLTAFCGYIVIENPHDSTQIGSPTYIINPAE